MKIAKRVMVRLDPELVRQAKALAALDGKSIGEKIEGLVKKPLAAEFKKRIK